MTLIDKARNKISDMVHAMGGKSIANSEKSEEDIAADTHVAGSRAGSDGNDGSYVGRTGEDVALDVEQSGAEARSEAKRLGR